MNFNYILNFKNIDYYFWLSNQLISVTKLKITENDIIVHDIMILVYKNLITQLYSIFKF